MNFNKKKLRKALYIYISLMLVLLLFSKTIYNFSLPKITVALPQNGRLAKELETHGVMTFSETFDIYANSSGQIDEMLIRKGDIIDKNTVIAKYKAATSDAAAKRTELGFTIKKIKNQLDSLALNKTDIQDKLRALKAKTPDDLYSYQCAVTDAKSTLEKLQAALAEAREIATSAFDDHSYQQTIADAERDWNRKKAELIEAKTALSEAETGNTASFDDFTYRQNIKEASIALERKKAELNDAEVALVEAKQADAPTLSVAEAEAQVKLAKNAVDDADRAYDKAVDELNRAKTAFATNMADSKKNAVSSAQKRVKEAQMELDDAECVYNRAVDTLNRAADKAALDTQKNLEDAETAVAGAQTMLERAETNLKLAQKALESKSDDEKKALDLELKKTDLDIARANIDLRAAETSNADKAETAVTSDYQGIVISAEIKKGQFVTQGEKIATVGVDNHLFTCEFSCSESDGRFIEIGDEADIHAKGVTSNIKATVYDIQPVGNTLKISLACETDGLKGGEYVSVKFHKQTQAYDTIIPNEAVFREGMSNFVWVIRSKQGALGREYYSVKIKVLVADSDDYHTAISKGLEYSEPVALSFNKNLIVNGRVNRLE